MKERDNKRILMFVLLNILLLIYSFTTVLSKFAAEAEAFSLSFFVYYGSVLGLLFVYAIVWQQIIKFLPLTTAYANRAIVVVWGIIWGVVIFKEQINVGKIVGALLVIAGVILFSVADGKEQAQTVKESVLEKKDISEPDNETGKSTDETTVHGAGKQEAEE